MAKIPTQGTDVYFSDDDVAVEKIGCAITINVGTSSADQIDVTCLSSKSREYIAGLATIGQITIAAAVDTDDTAFPKLDALQVSGKAVPWFIGLSDGTSAPTVTGGTMTPPTDRSGWSFEGFVASVSPQIEQNNVVKYELVIQPSAKLIWHASTAAASAAEQPPLSTSLT